MKFTPSSSYSSTSSTFTTTTSTNNTFTSESFPTSKVNALSCLTRFLGKILCPKRLPTHPSNTIERDKHQQQMINIEKIVDGSTTPNVVARLMGLDWLPENTFTTPHKAFETVSRSKSMSCVDFREETEEMQGQNRRMKASVSFRETPDYLELQDDDFFVLSFEGRSEKSKKNVGDKKHRRRRRRDKGVGKQRRSRDEQGKDRVFTDEERLSLRISSYSSKFDENVDDGKRQSYHLSPNKEKMNCGKDGVVDGSKVKKKKKKEKSLAERLREEAAKCESENASPVSVLDHSEFISDPEVTTSEEDAKLRGFTAARQDLESRDLSSDQSEGSSIRQGRESNRNGERHVGLKRSDYRKHENIEMLNRVCKLAEAEINNSNWKYRGILSADEVEDASTEFGQLIFDQLVSELVDQLVVEFI